MRRLAWSFLLALGFSSEASAENKPDVLLIDSACSSLGSAVGRNDKPIYREDAPKSFFVCYRRKTRLDCTAVSQDGDNFVGVGKTQKMVFESLSDTGDRFKLVEIQSATLVVVDRNSQAYVLAQHFVDDSTGMIMQKQCIGAYVAGLQVDRVLEKLGRNPAPPARGP
jgi:hypothetical protein